MELKIFSLSLIVFSTLSADLVKPSDLSLKALSSTEVAINWRDNSDSETGYKIFRDGTLIKTTMPDITSFKDKNLLPNHTYRYTIKATDDNPNKKSVSFKESNKALKNPLKGFMIRPNDTNSPHKYVTMFKAVINWDNVENSINDGVDKIKSYSEANLFNGRWYENKQFSVEDRNIKVNPEIVLKKEEKDDFSPSDMDIKEHDNQTSLFGDRVENLVKKLAQAWDNDPRIGFIYMGIVGTWGEQFSTKVSPSIAKVLGDSFSKYFKNKKVMVRVPNYFDEWYLKRNNNTYDGQKYTNYYRFGVYWDAFSWKHEEDIFEMSNIINGSKLWKDQPILGEVAFNVGNENIHSFSEYSDLKWPKNNQQAIHDTLTDPKTFEYLKDYIYSTHATALSWISKYNKNDPQEEVAAAKLQKAMGYRFVVRDAVYNDIIMPGGKMKIELNIKNDGSAPFYYDWPLQVALLDKDTKEVVYRHKFDNVDIRKWLPGDEWDNDKDIYLKSAKVYHVEQEFTLPIDLAKKEYILTIEIDDPSSMKPSIRFANVNYYKDGRMPIAMVGVGERANSKLPKFDDLSDDSMVNYAPINGLNHISSNNIQTIKVDNDANNLTFSMYGDFLPYSHYDFYIDIDNNSATGYRNGDIKGADYLVEDGDLYKYPKDGKGWKWDFVKTLSHNASSHIYNVVLPIDLVNLKPEESINFGASVTTSDWKNKQIYPNMKSYKLTNITIGARDLVSTSLEKGTLFASPNGDGDCSKNAPCDIYTAFSKLHSGDVLFLRGGVYKINKNLFTNRLASADAPIIIESYPGENAIIDGGRRSADDVAKNWNERIKGIVIGTDASYIYLRKLEVRYMGGAGIEILGSHNLVEGCNIHHNFSSGISVSDGGWKKDELYLRGYNIIRNNIVHDNSDVGLHASTGDGGNADGIWIGSGKNNKILHNTVYGNSDDGIDTWKSNNTYVAYNISYANGKGKGDGNGFKLGGNWDKANDRPKVDTKTGLGAIAKHNIAYNNKDKGFDFNLGMNVTIQYNTAYNNGGAGFVGAKIAKTKILNNISVDNVGGDMYSRKDWGEADNIDNSWNRGGEVKFISTDPNSPNFLIPKKDSGFGDIGAYASFEY